MKKSDLEIIIKKIQNRCYLESPTRITYYWDKNHKVVFKIFFESLYLPKDLRIDNDNIQNTFITQNVYEYEDDFTILELNQDEGYIKVLPDDQNFKVINSYRDANKDETIEESRVLHLTTKRLKENFALSKGYILYEVDNVEKIENPETLQIKKVKDKKETQAKTDANVYVIAIAFNLCKQALEKNGVLDQALVNAENLIKSDTSKTVSKLVFTIPKVLKEDLSATNLHSIRNFSEKLTEQFKDTYAYFGGNGNVQLSNMLSSLNIKHTYFLTSTAEESIKEANLPSLLDTTTKIENFEVIDDTTKDILTQAKDLAEKLINTYSKVVNKDGGVHKDFSQTKSGKKLWDKKRAFLKEKLKDSTVNAALSFCMDLYTPTKNSKDVEAAKERKSILDNLLKNVKNVGNSGENIAWYKQAAILIKNSPKIILASFLNVIKNMENETTTKGDRGSGVIVNPDFGGQTAGIKLKKGSNDFSKDLSTSSKKLKVTDYFTDFPIKIVVNKDGTGFNKDFEQLLTFFASKDVLKAEAVEAISGETPSTNDQKDEVEDKNQEKETENPTKDDLEKSSDESENTNTESTNTIDNSNTENSSEDNTTEEIE